MPYFAGTKTTVTPTVPTGESGTVATLTGLLGAKAVVVRAYNADAADTVSISASYTINGTLAATGFTAANFIVINSTPTAADNATGVLFFITFRGDTAANAGIAGSIYDKLLITGTKGTTSGLVTFDITPIFEYQYVTSIPSSQSIP